MREFPPISPKFESEPWQQNRFAETGREITPVELTFAAMINGLQLIRLEGIAPTERNFDVEATTGEIPTAAKVTFRKKQGEEFKDLQSYLPPDYTLTAADAFSLRRNSKKIYFNKAMISSRAFPLSIFHEVGHAHQNANGLFPDLKVTTRERWQAQIARKWQYLKEFMSELNIHTAGENMERFSDEDFLPLSFIERVEEGNAHIERDAWAFALRKLRELEREGYDVFAGFKNVKEIQAFIAYCLWSYELNRAQVLARGERLNYDNYEQLYLKK